MGVIMRNGVVYGDTYKDVSIVDELPEVGETNHLYVMGEKEALYYWNGEKYIKFIENQTNNVRAEKDQIIVGDGEKWITGGPLKIKKEESVKLPIKRFDHIEGNDLGNWKIVSMNIDNEKTEEYERHIFVLGEDEEEKFIFRAEDTTAFTMLNYSTFIAEGNVDIRFQNGTKESSGNQRTSFWMNGDASVKIGDSLISIPTRSTGTSVNITDGANVNICGWYASGLGSSGVPITDKNHSPFVKIAGKANVIIENAENQIHKPTNRRIGNFDTINGGGPTLVMHQDSTILSEGNSYLKLDDDAEIVFQDRSAMILQDESTVCLNGGAGISMNGLMNYPNYNSDSPISLNRQPRLIMNSGSQIIMNGDKDKNEDPFLVLNGSGGIRSNGGGLLDLGSNYFTIGGGYKGSHGPYNSMGLSSNLVETAAFLGSFKQGYYPPDDSDDYRFRVIAKKANGENVIINNSEEYMLRSIYNSVPSDYTFRVIEKSTKSRYCIDNEGILNVIEAYKEKGTTLTEQTIKNGAVVFYVVKEDKFQELMEAMEYNSDYYCNIATNEYAYSNKVNAVINKTKKTLDYFYYSNWELKTGYRDTYENYCKKNNIIPYLDFSFLRTFDDSVITTARYCKIDPYSYVENPIFEMNGKKYFYNITGENVNLLNAELKKITKIPYEFVIANGTTSNNQTFYELTKDGLDFYTSYFNSVAAPLVNIHDNIKVDMDTSKDANVWVKINSNGLASQTKVIHIDNSHTETRQNSILSLRGKCQQKYAYLDYPYKPIKNGSMLTLYGESRFIMRNYWNEWEEISGSIVFYSDDLTAATSMTNLSESAKEGFDKTMEELNYTYIPSEEEILTSETLSNGKIKYTLSNCKYKSSIPMRMPKEEGSPLMELIEDAELRMEGNGTINVTSEGISINGIEFTNEQLAALKNLLN